MIRRVVQRSSALLVLESPWMSLTRDALWHNGLATLKAGTALTVLLDRSGQAELDQQRLKTRVAAQAVEIDGCRMLAEFTTGVVPAFKCEARS